jgi:hypothetical protein
VRVGVSEKAKGALQGLAVNQSITDRPSETEKEDIMRWESGRAWASDRLIEWERSTIENIEGRMENLGIWAREGSEVIGSGWVFLRHHIEKDMYRPYSAVAKAEMR